MTLETQTADSARAGRCDKPKCAELVPIPSHEERENLLALSNYTATPQLIKRTSLTWKDLVRLESGLDELEQLAHQVTPPDKPKTSAFGFYLAAAAKLVGPKGSNPHLRKATHLDVAVAHLGRVLGMEVAQR